MLRPCTAYIICVHLHICPDMTLYRCIIAWTYKTNKSPFTAAKATVTINNDKLKLETEFDNWERALKTDIVQVR